MEVVVEMEVKVEVEVKVTTTHQFLTLIDAFLSETRSPLFIHDHHIVTLLLLFFLLSCMNYTFISQLA